MHILFRFLLFTAILACILFMIGALAWVWVRTYPIYSMVNTMRAMTQGKIYNLAPGSNVTVYPDGTITVREGAYNDDRVHVWILPDNCLSVTEWNMTMADTYCAQGRTLTLTLPPGRYYMETSHYVPMYMQVNTWLTLMTPIIAAIIAFLIVIYLIHTRIR